MIFESVKFGWEVFKELPGGIDAMDKILRPFEIELKPQILGFPKIKNPTMDELGKLVDEWKMIDIEKLFGKGWLIGFDITNRSTVTNRIRKCECFADKKRQPVSVPPELFAKPICPAETVTGQFVLPCEGLAPPFVESKKIVFVFRPLHGRAQSKTIDGPFVAYA